MTRGPDPTAPLWRAAQAFRLLSCLYALGFQTAINSDLATLDGIFRVAAFIVVGLVLLSMGAGYARSLADR